MCNKLPWWWLSSRSGQILNVSPSKFVDADSRQSTIVGFNWFSSVCQKDYHSKLLVAYVKAAVIFSVDQNQDKDVAQPPGGSGAEIKYTLHAVPPLNKLKLDQQSRQQVLRPHCPIYTVITYLVYKV